MEHFNIAILGVIELKWAGIGHFSARKLQKCSTLEMTNREERMLL